MDAAATLFESTPVMNVTGRQIAEAAGVNHGQIHHYFGSKDALIAATIADGAARYHQDRMRDGEVFPLPIETHTRAPAWRTLAYLASTGQWRQPPFEPSPVVGFLLQRRAADLQLPASDTRVAADVAAVMALQRGWWIFQDMIESGLAPFDPDLATVRDEVAARSLRLVDESISLGVVTGLSTHLTLRSEEARTDSPRGRDAVRERLLHATLDLLADRSPMEVTTKEIATAAGVNHGQVHHYFESKEHLIAHAVRVGASAILAAIESDRMPAPVPIQTEMRLPLWRTLAYLAATEEWADEAYDRSPVVDRMVRVVAARTGRPENDPIVHGQVAAVHAMELGWAIYRNIIEYALEPLGVDLASARRRMAEISARLVDDDARPAAG